jgi:hypothetical protein
VRLVGHSYGGAVISVAGAIIANEVGLVYVAAEALDEGESVADIFARFGDTARYTGVTEQLPAAERGDGHPAREPAPVRRDHRPSRAGCSLEEAEGLAGCNSVGGLPNGRARLRVATYRARHAWGL